MRIFVGEVEINDVFTVNAQFLIYADIKDFASGNMTRNMVAVSRIFFFKEVPRFSVLICPNTSAFTACRLTHETKFVVSGDGCRVNLDEFTVGIVSPLLVNG